MAAEASLAISVWNTGQRRPGTRSVEANLASALQNTGKKRLTKAIAATADKNIGQTKLQNSVLGAALRNAGSGKDCLMCNLRRPSSELTDGSPSLSRTNILIGYFVVPQERPLATVVSSEERGCIR